MTVTPSSNRVSNSRPRIMASAMSVTWNSSKQSSRVSWAISLAIGTMVSASGGAPLAASSSRRLCRRACTSSMNSWKWTRRFFATGASAKNRSISIDLPRPTGPQM